MPTFMQKLRNNWIRLKDETLDPPEQDITEVLDRLLSQKTKDLIQSDLAPHIADVVDEVTEEYSNAIRQQATHLPEGHPLRDAIEGIPPS